jgi:hypothetical protein
MSDITTDIDTTCHCIEVWADQIDAGDTLISPLDGERYIIEDVHVLQDRHSVLLWVAFSEGPWVLELSADHPVEVYRDC